MTYDDRMAELDADIRRAGFRGYDVCAFLGFAVGCPTPYMCSERGDCPRPHRSFGAPVGAPEPPEQRSHLRLVPGPHSEPDGALVDGWDDDDAEDDELPVSWFRPVVDVPTGGRL